MLWVHVQPTVCQHLCMMSVAQRVLVYHIKSFVFWSVSRLQNFEVCRIAGSLLCGQENSHVTRKIQSLLIPLKLTSGAQMWVLYYFLNSYALHTQAFFHTMQPMSHKSSGASLDLLSLLQDKQHYKRPISACLPHTRTHMHALHPLAKFPED